MTQGTTLDRTGQTDSITAVASVDDIASATSLDARPFAGGFVRSSVTGTFTAYISLDDGVDDDFEVAKDQDGVELTMSLTADQKKELPSWWFAVPFIKFVGAAATLKFYQAA